MCSNLQKAMQKVYVCIVLANVVVVSATAFVVFVVVAGVRTPFPMLGLRLLASGLPLVPICQSSSCC